jgi:hypothetical protein
LTNHLLPAFHDKRLSEIDYEAIRTYRTARLREGARRKRAREAGAPLRDRRGRPLRPFGSRHVNASLRLLAQVLDRAARSQLFALAHHPARDRDLKVKREKPIYRRYLEADELLDLLDAAVAIDQRSRPETLALAETVRQLREVERLLEEDRRPHPPRRVDRDLAVKTASRRPARAPHGDRRARALRTALAGGGGTSRASP